MVRADTVKGSRRTLTLYMHMDRPNGEPRLTYVRLDRTTVTAFVTFIQCPPVDGERCYNVG